MRQFEGREQLSERAVVLIPAFNEEECIGGVLEEIRRHAPGLDVVVINDDSQDGTAAAARRMGAQVLDLPCNLGVGGAVQAGFRYAYEQGYDCAVRCDGDGQHAPEDIPLLLRTLREGGVDLVIGSRYLGRQTFSNTIVRSLGIGVLSLLLTVICRKKITDPTSGFQAVSRPLMYFFSRQYPTDYPEPEALALLRRQGYDFREVPATFRGRMAGRSTIGGWGTPYYAVKVLLALVVDRARPADVRFARHIVADMLARNRDG